MPPPLTALDFFAGSGLVTQGLKPSFRVIWANDICPKKQAVYAANFGAAHLDGRSIADIHGPDVPHASLAWGSFPCQDLSLAGDMRGMDGGTRSSLYYEWLRVIREMEPHRRPPVLCVENVVGFLVAGRGKPFAAAYRALKDLGYAAGALVIDAVHFVPQSRPRAFLVAAAQDIPLHGLTLQSPDPAYHTKAVLTACAAAADNAWIWWRLPPPPRLKQTLAGVCEFDAPFDPPEKTAYLLSLLSPVNRAKLDEALKSGQTLVGAGYRRVRPDEHGVKRQRLEIRFDGLAGCLRTPNGGSSRQIAILVKDGRVHTRLLTVRETARLMGVRDSFKIPGTYNDGYRAMGDAVAVPVTAWIAKHLLKPLAQRAAHAARP